jgi:hypothetical protein
MPAAAAANKGFYYRVSVAGTTSVDGVAEWKAGDWIVSEGSVWAKIDNTDAVTDDSNLPTLDPTNANASSLLRAVLTNIWGALGGKANSSHAHADATSIAAGFMPASDKAKLDRLTLATNTSITGGGTLALAGHTLTVPASGTAMLTEAANTMGAAASIDFSGTSDVGVVSLVKLSAKTVEAFPSGLCKNVATEFFNLAGTSGSTTILGGGVDADAFRRIRILADGRILMGSGTAVADVTLRRPGVAQMQVVGSLAVHTSNMTPTALLHLGAGGTAANSAALKFTSGSLLTTPEAGTVGYNNKFYFTESDGQRRAVVQAVSGTKIAGAPATDGFITLRIDGVDVKVMTTA